MSLSLSSIVNVTVSTSPAAAQRTGFGTLNFCTNETGVLTTSDPIRLYTALDSVITDWGASSEVAKAATAYFAQNPKPKKLKVSFRDDTSDTIADSLTAINNVDSDWYGLVFDKTIRDAAQVQSEDAVIKAADWVEANKKFFGNTINAAAAVDAADSTDMGSQLKAKTLRRTLSTYSSSVDEYPSVSALGRMFTVDFAAANSTITLMFKQLPTITVESLSSSDHAALKGKNVNAFVTFGGTNIYSDSVMSSGVFADEVHGVDWLQDALQNTVYNYLYTRTTKVPYTDKGVAALEQQLVKALNEGVRNGLIGTGTTSDGEFLALGYKTTVQPVAEVSAADKSARKYSGLSAVAIGAGAIHNVEINVLFEK